MINLNERINTTKEIINFEGEKIHLLPATRDVYNTLFSFLNLEDKDLIRVSDTLAETTISLINNNVENYVVSKENEKYFTIDACLEILTDYIETFNALLGE